MGDIKVDNFKTNVTKAVETWKLALDVVAKKLAKNAAEIDKIEAIKAPTAADKARLAVCIATREKLRQEVEKVNLTLKAQLIVLSKSLPDKSKANEKELIQLPDWTKKLIKDKGIQVLKGVVITPSVEFEFQGKSLKTFGIKITW